MGNLFMAYHYARRKYDMVLNSLFTPILQFEGKFFTKVPKMRIPAKTATYSGNNFTTYTFIQWTRKSWKDGAGKIYCINWQRPLCRPTGGGVSMRKQGALKDEL
jgi:hypothetical protein